LLEEASLEVGSTWGAVVAQFVPLIVIYGLMIVPYWKLFRRQGRAGWWALLGFGPLLGIIALPWLLLALRGKSDPRIGEVFR
jgi:hypothetical protein